MHVWARRPNFGAWAISIDPHEKPQVLGHRNFIKSGMHCSGLASFQKTLSRIDHNDVWLRQGAQCSLFTVLPYFGITLQTPYFIPTQSHYTTPKICVPIREPLVLVIRRP